MAQAVATPTRNGSFPGVTCPRGLPDSPARVVRGLAGDAEGRKTMGWDGRRSCPSRARGLMGDYIRKKSARRVTPNTAGFAFLVTPNLR